MRPSWITTATSRRTPPWPSSRVPARRTTGASAAPAALPAPTRSRTSRRGSHGGLRRMALLAGAAWRPAEGEAQAEVDEAGGEEPQGASEVGELDPLAVHRHHPPAGELREGHGGGGVSEVEDVDERLQALRALEAEPLLQAEVQQGGGGL